MTRLVLVCAVLLILACTFQPVPTQSQASSPTPPPATAVTIHGRQIEVNGRAFLIKGVGYAPTPIGTDAELPNPNGDSFSAASSALYQRDLPLLRSMGANAVRLWGWDSATDHTAFLDAAYNNGKQPIYVIPTFWINAGLDLSDPTTRQSLVDGFRQMVVKHKDHPAVLMWMIGNELNAPWMYGDSDELFTLINAMARAAHDEEGPNRHPVTTPLADTNLVATIQQREAQVPDLDLWSVQVYRGDSFGTLFDDYAAASSKPLFISEYGIDAYDDAHQAEYEQVQADYDEALWREIAQHFSTCAGGSIMAYSDEWWKGKHGQTDAAHPDCPEYDPSKHSDCGYAASSHPDGYSNEEWWGIMRPVKSPGGPDAVQPRAVYDRLKAVWSEGRLFVPVVDGLSQ